MLLSMKDRGSLALEVYKTCLPYFELPGGKVGAQLTYLIDSILDGVVMDLDFSFKENRKFYEILQSVFDCKHPIWIHINLEF